MLKFQCNSCGNTKDLMKATIKIIDGKVRTAEALCECGEYMEEVKEDPVMLESTKKVIDIMHDKRKKL